MPVQLLRTRGGGVIHGVAYLTDVAFSTSWLFHNHACDIMVGRNYTRSIHTQLYTYTRT